MVDNVSTTGTFDDVFNALMLLMHVIHCPVGRLGWQNPTGHVINIAKVKYVQLRKAQSILD